MPMISCHCSCECDLYDLEWFCSDWRLVEENIRNDEDYSEKDKVGVRL